MRAIRRIGCPIATLAVSVLFSTSLYSQPTPKIERIVIEKSAHTMMLMRDGKVWKSYKVALSREAVGAKDREGDHKVPEGDYIVDSKNAHSRFHLALHISYPNAADVERAQKLGFKPGGTLRFTA